MTNIQKNLHDQGHITRAIRIAMDMDQSEFSAHMGYSEANSIISQVERGLVRTPRLRSVSLLPNPLRIYMSLLKSPDIIEFQVQHLDYLTNYVNYGWMPFEAKCVAKLNGRTFSKQLGISNVDLSRWTLGRKPGPSDQLQLWAFERSIKLGQENSPFLRTFESLIKEN